MPPKSQFIKFYTTIVVLNIALIVFNLALALGHRTPYRFINQQLDLTDEGNIAVWFSSAQLLIVGLVALMNGLLIRPNHISSNLHRLVWFSAVIVMVGLSVDETAQIHEWLGERFSDVSGAEHSSHMLGLSGGYTWLLLLSPLILGATIMLAWTSIRCIGRCRHAMLISFAGLLFWIIVIGCEYFEARFMSAESGIARGLQPVIEEGSEILGAAMFLIAFLEYLRTQFHARTQPINL